MNIWQCPFCPLCFYSLLPLFLSLPPNLLLLPLYSSIKTYVKGKRPLSFASLYFFHHFSRQKLKLAFSIVNNTAPSVSARRTEESGKKQEPSFLRRRCLKTGAPSLRQLCVKAALLRRASEARSSINLFRFCESQK